MSLAHQIAHNTAIQSIGKIITTLLGIVAFGMMTRYLDTAGYGAYTTITSFLQFFGIIADCGLSLMAIQMMAEVGRDSKKSFQTAFTLRLVIVSACALLAPLIALAFPYPWIIKVGIAAMTLSFVLSSLIQMMRVIFQVHLRMDIALLADVVSYVVLVAGIAAAIGLNTGLFGIIFVITLNNIVQLLILALPAKRFTPLTLGIDWIIAREMVRRSWPIALSIVFNLMYLRTDTIILSLVQSQEVVGLYGAAYRVIDVLASLPSMFMGVALAAFSRSYSSQDHASFARYFQKSFDFIALMALPLVVATQFLARDALVFVSGAAFEEAGAILQILIIGCGALFFGTLFGYLINVVHAQRTMLWAYGTTALVCVIGYAIVIPRFSYWGAAWITVFSEALVACLGAYVFWRVTHIRPRLESLVKAGIASGVMALVLTLLAGYPLIVTSIASLLAYCIALYLLGGTPRDLAFSLLRHRYH